jgi:glycosyltransferase involved in cell wall biosynthesis
MKILAYVHGYPPNLNGGAEMMLHQMLLDLQKRGHQVDVITNNVGLKEYEGVPLYDINDLRHENLIASSDLLFTHLVFTSKAIKLSKKYNKNVVHLLHNDYDIKNHDVVESAIRNPKSVALIVANSKWIQDTLKDQLPSIIVNPPTRVEKYKTETTKEFVTLINLHGTKGGDLFWELAEKMPEMQFMGVKGGWGDPILKSGFSNVTILENTTDIKSVYAKTKILIMPSTYESWGRVAVEAACSGIPVIATPMPGPKESLGSAAIFADNQNFSEWYEAIQTLNDESIYSEYSEAVQKRAEELDKEFDSQMDVLEKSLLKIVFTA